MSCHLVAQSPRMVVDAEAFGLHGRVQDLILKASPVHNPSPLLNTSDMLLICFQLDIKEGSCVGWQSGSQDMLNLGS